MSAGRPRLCFFLLVLCTSLGCSHGNQELLENELRARDIQYREVIDELKKSSFQNESLQREIESLRKGSTISPEQAAQTYGLKRITLGRGTTGFDNDRIPGDEALQVAVEPRDGYDHIIKTPGNLQVQALEINAQGVKVPMSTWDIDPEQLRQSWKQGLFSTGYVLILPWKSWPQSENIRVIARLTLSDGRVFEADKDIKLRLAPEGIPAMPKPGSTQEPLVPQIPPSSKVPSTHSAAKVAYHQVNRWQPAPLDNAVKLGRPEPLQPPTEVNLLGLTVEPSNPWTTWGR